MPRNLSFHHTRQQIKVRTKTVTRRRGRTKHKPGDLVWAIEKGQGLKRGEKVKRLALLRVLHVDIDALNGPTLTQDDVHREGFPGMKPPAFVAMFCQHMGGEPDQEVSRIEFEYIDDPDLLRESRPKTAATRSAGTKSVPSKRSSPAGSRPQKAASGRRLSTRKGGA